MYMWGIYRFVLVNLDDSLKSQTKYMHDMRRINIKLAEYNTTKAIIMDMIN